MGIVEGDGCTNSVSHSFEGDATLINPVMSFSAVIHSSGGISVTVESIHVTNLTLNWDDIDVSALQIDIFTPVLSEVQAAIAVGVADATRTVVNEAFLEDAIETILPLDLGGTTAKLMQALVLAIISALSLGFTLINVVPLFQGF